MSVINYKELNSKPIIENAEVLNKHFKSLIFLVCIKRKYAKSFIERGTIRFAQPKEWKPDGTSRGDILEGVFASRLEGDNIPKNYLCKLRTQTKEIKYKSYYFYKSDKICGARAYCVYSLFDTSLAYRNKRSQDHRFHKGGIISKEYFKDLFSEWSRKKYEETEDDDKPMVLIINPENFTKRLLSVLIEKGINQDEIVIQPIQYFDYLKEPFLITPELFELFYKDITYINQHEVRFVINTKRKFVRNFFNNNDGVIDLGPIDESIATLSEFYFDDMHLEIRDNKLLYSLANPIVRDIQPIDLINFIYQALADELPESPLSIEEIENKIDNFESKLKGFNIIYDKTTQRIEFDGKLYDVASTSGYRIIEHYDNYMKDNDLEGAKDSIEKFHHFFPMYDMEYYFEEYYKKQK